jgi:hypothetical protein
MALVGETDIRKTLREIAGLLRDDPHADYALALANVLSGPRQIVIDHYCAAG